MKFNAQCRTMTSVSQLLRRNVWAAVIGTAVVTLALVAPGVLHFERAPVVVGVVQTVIAVVGTLVAFLFFGRYRRSGEIADLLLVFAVLALAWVHTAYDVIPNLVNPHSLGDGYSERVEIWGAASTRIAAAWYVLVSTGSKGGRRRPRRWTWRNTTLLWMPALVALVATVPADIWLPVSHAGLLGTTSVRDVLSPLADLAGALMFLVAGWRLSQRSISRSDDFLGWVATGCVLGAFALISSGLVPSHSSYWLRPSDLLRALMVSVWAWGAAVEIRNYWSGIAELSKREAERKMALELHDGVAQELALLASYLHASPQERSEPAWHEWLQGTADRALTEIRRTIRLLASDKDPAMESDLQRTLRGFVHGGEPVHIEIEADGDFSIPDRLDRESIVRIVREAVLNAVRHGHAASIRIQLLSADDCHAVRVLDDGVGFDPDTVERRGRFGLVSMEEQAEALGATLAIESVRGEGTTVELAWT